MREDVRSHSFLAITSWFQPKRLAKASNRIHGWEDGDSRLILRGNAWFFVRKQLFITTFIVDDRR
jgi:hypothetical protein